VIDDLSATKTAREWSQARRFRSVRKLHATRGRDRHGTSSRRWKSACSARPNAGPTASTCRSGEFGRRSPPTRNHRDLPLYHVDCSTRSSKRYPLSRRRPQRPVVSFTIPLCRADPRSDTASTPSWRRNRAVRAARQRGGLKPRQQHTSRATRPPSPTLRRFGFAPSCKEGV
jgi:hypothetical protein